MRSPTERDPLTTQVQRRIGKVHLGTSTLTLTCQRIAMLFTRNRTHLLGNDEQAIAFSFFNNLGMLIGETAAERLEV